MMIAAKSADQKLSMVRADDQRAVSSNIAALMTTIKSPSESKTAGSVSNLISDPMVVLMTEKRSATQK